MPRKRTLPEVEIIPWAHREDALAHVDTVRYIQSLPHHSVLLLETSPTELADIRQFAYDVSQFQTVDAAISNLRRYAGKLAGVEIVHECRKNQIQVVPLRFSVAHRFSVKEPVNTSERVASVTRVNNTSFANQLARTLRHTNAEKVYALIGVMHVTALKNAADKMGAHTTVQFDHFSEKYDMEQFVEIFGELMELYGKKLSPDQARQKPVLESRLSKLKVTYLDGRQRMQEIAQELVQWGKIREKRKGTPKARQIRAKNRRALRKVRVRQGK